MNRFMVPEQYCRVQCNTGSFCNYLRNLPLAKKGTSVRYYNGSIREWASYAAVVDLEIGNKNLHQCADAVIRLKADYWYQARQYDNIIFQLTNGMNVPYAKWAKGYRVKVNGNKTTWRYHPELAGSENEYWEYLEFIWSYAGTASLDQQLRQRDAKDVRVGDILLQGGHPGHAVIILDIIEHRQTGDQMMLLAQSYMPAQSLHVILNPERGDVWFNLTHQEVFVLPDWTFYDQDFKVFAE